LKRALPAAPLGDPGRPQGLPHPPAPDPAPVFAALGDATRLALVSRLSDGQARSITHLSGGLGLARQGVTKHLRVLEQAGLVDSIRVGRESRYAFKPQSIGAVRSYLDAISLHWDDALSRLKDFVEE
jgi:DNA-binding transcriptional ArsR family regulator